MTQAFNRMISLVIIDVLEFLEDEIDGMNS